MSQCSSKFACRTCKHCHHTSLYQAFSVDTQHTPTSPPPQPNNSQAASSQTNSSQTSNSQQTSSQTASSQQNVAISQQASAQPTSGYITMASAPPTALYTSVCLLKTAIAEVSSYTTIAEGHILFDEGAQRFFITQELADELHLRPTSQETISEHKFPYLIPLR